METYMYNNEIDEEIIADAVKEYFEYIEPFNRLEDINIDIDEEGLQDEIENGLKRRYEMDKQDLDLEGIGINDMVIEARKRLIIKIVNVGLEKGLIRMSDINTKGNDCEA